MHERLMDLLDEMERQLAENEDWFRWPEEDMFTFEEEMHEWNKEFMKWMTNIEKIMEEFGRRME
ncbi:hypothetical protein [Lentibacillus cibarius]|uniref:Uncharacterized protein n=1 Tax=Lentibacillus cibarius TaxID=2583219 RepID=A0A5S3QPM9_9BACI|nr:hypothetical protein [Lentibacillus cibarius]TMN23141.1 hypothetical protein FFL34_14375 [Lentibacillus cibarius]